MVHIYEVDHMYIENVFAGSPIDGILLESRLEFPWIIDLLLIKLICIIFTFFGIRLFRIQIKRNKILV